MKFRSTWILIVVLGIVAAYFFLVEERSREAERRTTVSSRTVLPYNRDEVERFVLINPQGERIAAERDGDGWTIVHPTRTKGSTATIDAFLLQVVPGIKLEEFIGVTNLGDYGFNDPFATVILTAAGRSGPDTIYVGDKTPTSAKCYIRLGDSRDVIITRELTHNVMNKNLYHMRDKNFLDIESGMIDRLAIRSGPVRTTVVRHDGRWRFAGSRRHADRLTIERYLNVLTTAIIRGFVQEDLEGLERFGLASPFMELGIGSKVGDITVFFGDVADGRVYAVRSGIDKVISLRGDVLEIFSKDESALRAMDLAFFDSEAVTTIRAETGAEVIVLAAEDGRWRVAGPDSTPVPAYAVRRLLGALQSLRFEELFDASFAPPPIRDGGPSISITVADRSGAAIDRVMIAASTDGYEFGSSTSAMTLGRLPDGTADRVIELFRATREQRPAAPEQRTDGP